jgi:hypothetical protein
VRALWLRVDAIVAVGLAPPAIVAFVFLIESPQDHELSGLIAMGLIEYVSVAAGAK